MTNPIKIRTATPYDVWPLEGLMLEAQEEAGGKMPPVNFQEAAHATIDLALAGMILVAVEEGEDKRQRVVGAIAMKLSSWCWNSDFRFIETVHYFVSKPYRSRSTAEGQSVGVALLKAARDLADASGVAMVVSHYFPADNSLKDEMIQRAGFQPMGGNYLFIPQSRQGEVPAAAE